jgi:hypothetical protein
LSKASSGLLLSITLSHGHDIFFIVFVKDLIFALLITRLYFEVLVTFFLILKLLPITRNLNRRARDFQSPVTNMNFNFNMAANSLLLRHESANTRVFASHILCFTKQFDVSQ